MKTLALQSLTIKREGRVDWRVSGDTHCGPKSEVRDGVMPVHYALTCTCEPTLDGRGFLFDQASVDLWMRRQASVGTTSSCEELVVHVAQAFLGKLAHDVPHCRPTHLALSLSPAPHVASVTAEFGRRA